MKIWKKLIVPCVVLVALVVGFLVLRAVVGPAEGETPPTTTAATTLPLDQRPSALPRVGASSIVSVTIKKRDGSVGKIFRTTDSTEDMIVWGYEDSTMMRTEQLPVDQAALSGQISALAIFTETSSIDGGMEKLEEFGLDNPAFTLEFEYLQDEKRTVYLGNMTFDERGVYCYSDQGVAVAVIPVAKLNSCEKTALDFLQKKILSLNVEDIISIDFARASDKLQLTTRLIPTDAETSAMYAQQTGSDPNAVFYMSEIIAPLKRSGSEGLTQILQTLIDMTAAEFIELNPNDLNAYMLETPEYSFVLHTETKGDIEIKISKNLGGRSYAMTSLYDAVFSIDTTSLSGLQFPLINLVDTFIFFNTIGTVSEVKASYAEGDFVLTLDVPEGASPIDEESVVLLNGVDAKVKSETAAFVGALYTSNACMRLSGFDFEAAPVNTKDIAIEISMKDGTSHTLDLVKRDQDTYYAFIDGEYDGSLVSSSAIYRDGGADVYNYGSWALYEKTLEAIAGAVNGVYPLKK